MAGETIIEKSRAGEPSRVIARDGDGPGVRHKDQSRLPNQPLSLDTPTAIHKLRITRDEFLNGFRWACVGDRADEIVEGGTERGFDTPPAHELCEVVSQEAASRGLHDQIYDELIPGQADAVRAAIVDAAAANKGGYEVGGKYGTLSCPIAFDAGYMLTHENPDISVVRLPQPNGTDYELDVSTVPEEQIAQAQEACYASETASTAGGLVAGMARGLEFGLDLSDAGGATPPRQRAVQTALAGC